MSPQPMPMSPIGFQSLSLVADSNQQQPSKDGCTAIKPDTATTIEREMAEAIEQDVAPTLGQDTTPPSKIDSDALTVEHLCALAQTRLRPHLIPCLWRTSQECQARLASDALLAKHVWAHVVAAVKDRATMPTSEEGTAAHLECYWERCTSPPFGNVTQLAIHVRQHLDILSRSFCPLKNCPNPLMNRPETHFRHAHDNMFTADQLRPSQYPISPSTTTASAAFNLPPLPRTVPSYMLTCDPVQPSRPGSGTAAAPLLRDLRIPILDERDPDAPFHPAGHGLPSNVIHWMSSDFFPSTVGIYDDDETEIDDALQSANRAPSSLRRVMPFSRGRPRGRSRSHSVALSDASYTPSSPGIRGPISPASRLTSSSLTPASSSFPPPAFTVLPTTNMGPPPLPRSTIISAAAAAAGAPPLYSVEPSRRYDPDPIPSASFKGRAPLTVRRPTTLFRLCEIPDPIDMAAIRIREMLDGADAKRAERLTDTKRKRKAVDHEFDVKVAKLKYSPDVLARAANRWAYLHTGRTFGITFSEFKDAFDRAGQAPVEPRN